MGGPTRNVLLYIPMTVINFYGFPLQIPMNVTKCLHVYFWTECIRVTFVFFSQWLIFCEACNWMWEPNFGDCCATYSIHENCAEFIFTFYALHVSNIILLSATGVR